MFPKSTEWIHNPVDVFIEVAKMLSQTNDMAAIQAKAGEP